MTFSPHKAGGPDNIPGRVLQECAEELTTIFPVPKKRSPRVSSTKFLGVHIAEDLTWNTNTGSLANKAQQRLFFLHKLRRATAPVPIMHSFYSGTIESILTSCITV